MLGDSTNGDTDDDDEGVDQGVPLSSASQHHCLAPKPTEDPYMTPIADVAPSLSTAAVSLSIPIVDEFYNVAGKAPHLEAIVSKKELGW